MRFATLSILASFLLAGTATAAELRDINVEHSRGQYTVNSVVWFDASVEQVFEVFRQWDLSTKFSSAIVESRDVEADEFGRPQYYVRHEGCLLFFCKSFVRQGYVELEVNETLRAIANPDISDFRLSNETWTFVAEEGGTIVAYHLQVEPKFWIPPGIGPYLIKRKFRNNGGDAIDRIEAIAQGVSTDTVATGRLN
ncbi:MAG: hypothetical protein GY949_05565 [Gammaproteobacteria bacterium]|nr:hypothetical protein [Gammaproteobacteria bacterium]